MGNRSVTLGLAGMLAACGAVAGPGPLPEATGLTPTSLNVPRDIGPAMGRVVRISGALRREKAGDSVDLGGVPVYCESLRLPEALVGQTVTIEGTLVSVVADEPLVNARGEVSQGEEPGSVRYVLRACVLR